MIDTAATSLTIQTRRIWRWGRAASLAVCLALTGGTLALACTGEPHIVTPGETLADIARRHSASPSAADTIHALNYDVLGPNVERLEPGMALSVLCPFVDIADNWWIVVGPALVEPMQFLFDAQLLDIRSGVRPTDPVIAGSISIPAEDWYGREGASGPLKDEAELNALIGAAGLQIDQPIVIVHERNSALSMGPAAYVYWILKSMGAQRISIVASGFDGWVAEGRPLTTARDAPEPYEARHSFSDQWRAEAAVIRDIVFGERDGLLLDGSYTPVYRTDRRGRAQIVRTIPGARHLSAPASFTVFAREHLQPRALIDMLERAAGDWRQRTLVSFSSDGPMGALNWFYVSEVAGVDNVLFFPEATRGWTASGQALGLGAQTAR